MGHLTEAASNLVDALGSQQDEIEQREAWINERLKAHPEMARRIAELREEYVSERQPASESYRTD